MPFFTNPMDSIFYILVLIISVVAHEVAHGYVAYRFGDNTAKMMGRLTLNPIPHLDLFGSILLPLLLTVTNAGFMFGWAKPVPVNSDNFKPEERKKAMFFVSIAGIVVNLLIASFFALVIRSASILVLPEAVIEISALIVFMNILLAVFNAVPVPPLDGAGILFSFLPDRFSRFERMASAYALPLFIIVVFFIWPIVSPLVYWLFSLMTGISFNL
jgi:Zn-dependent protease